MPVGIMTFSTETTPELTPFATTRKASPTTWRDVVSRVDGVTLLGLFFDVGAEKAYALVEGLDDYRDVKAVSRILGGEGFIKMVRPAQAAEAISREDTYRGGSSG